MAAQFIVLAAALLIAHHARAGFVPAGPFLAPRAVPAVAVAPVAPPIPHYSFAYDVKDSLTGDFKSQVESRTGDVVQGRYTVLDPDGHKRIVHYTADPVHGFNAVVSRIPIVVCCTSAPGSCSATATGSCYESGATFWGSSIWINDMYNNYCIET